jgi:Na+-transporting methylmalonyl-CoA/oxaloacetate decarboxylase gamma subunit
MDLFDALTITGLGMAVVFSGLLLTAGLIVALGRVQRFFEASHVGDGDPPKPPVSTGGALGPPVDPEVLTVITTVLEVERRLHRVGRGGIRETDDE